MFYLSQIPHVSELLIQFRGCGLLLLSVSHIFVLVRVKHQKHHSGFIFLTETLQSVRLSRQLRVNRSDTCWRSSLSVWSVTSCLWINILFKPQRLMLRLESQTYSHTVACSMYATGTHYFIGHCSFWSCTVIGLCSWRLSRCGASSAEQRIVGQNS